MQPVWLALGSNLGDREQHLRRAIMALHSTVMRVIRISPVYETAPQGYLEQAWFLNLVLAAETSLSPIELLTHCESVERLLKRERSVVNGPRSIDVDILLYADTRIHTERLELPHPRYRERRFVLQPLADLEPELRDPVTRVSVQEMLSKVCDQAIRPTPIIIEPPEPL